jgi:uncharacterized protein
MDPRSFWRDCAVCVPVAPGEALGAALRLALRALRPGELHWGAPPLLGRAAQMNAQALRSRKAWLLFLHADTGLPAGFAAVAAQARPGALNYFGLRFDGGPARAAWNARAAQWRSRVFGLPFGDQGFLIRRDDFLALGGFDESLPYGEDLDLAVRAWWQGLPRQALPARLHSSARKYARHGWGRTTLRHVADTLRLAVQAHWRAWRSRPWAGAVAVAAFVKTPGLLPLKTRLAAGIGKARATAVYKASLALIEALLGEAQRSRLFAPYWNVAEAAGVKAEPWRALPARYAGDGSLAQKLAGSYRELLALHPAVIFIGADAPQLGLGDLLKARQALLRHDFVVQGARDGGYVLFGGRKALPEALWLGVPLSQADTGARFVAALRAHGSVAELPPLCDIDTAADLPVAGAELRRALASQGPAARKASALWLKRTAASRS